MKLLILLVAILLSACGSISPKPTPDIRSMTDQEAATALVQRVIGDELISAEINPQVPAVLITFEADGYVGLTELEIGKMICTLRRSGRFPGHVYQYIGKADLVYTDGRTSFENVVTVRMQADTIAGLDCSNDAFGQVFGRADTYWVHDSLRKR